MAVGSGAQGTGGCARSTRGRGLCVPPQPSAPALPGPARPGPTPSVPRPGPVSLPSRRAPSPWQRVSRRRLPQRPRPPPAALPAAPAAGRPRRRRRASLPGPGPGPGSASRGSGRSRGSAAAEGKRRERGEEMAGGSCPPSLLASPPPQRAGAVGGSGNGGSGQDRHLPRRGRGEELSCLLRYTGLGRRARRSPDGGGGGGGRRFQDIIAVGVPRSSTEIVAFRRRRGARFLKTALGSLEVRRLFLGRIRPRASPTERVGGRGKNAPTYCLKSWIFINKIHPGFIFSNAKVLSVRFPFPYTEIQDLGFPKGKDMATRKIPEELPCRDTSSVSKQ